jgi:hypothetical protein
MLCIEQCKKSNTCTIFVRGGNKMVNLFMGESAGFLSFLWKKFFFDFDSLVRRIIVGNN